jgi:hypothetical protein
MQKSGGIDLLTCLGALESHLEKSFELEGPFSESTYEVVLDYLKLLFCAEEWSQLIEVSSKVIEQERVKGLKISHFYRYWLEGLKSLDDLEGLQALTGHLLTLSKDRPPSKERLDLCVLGLVWTNQKLSSKMVLQNRLREFPKEKPVEALLVYQYYFGGEHDVSATDLKKFSEKANFLSLVNIFNLTRSETLSQNLLENHPYYVGPYLLKSKSYLKEEKYQDALKWLNVLYQWYPQNLESIMGQAYCYHKLGDHLYCYEFLKKYESLFDENDWDYQRFRGEVCVNLYERYQNEIFRLEGLSFLRKAEKTSQALGLQTLGIKSQLDRLSADVVVKEKRKPLSHAGKRYWLVQLEEKRFKAFMEKYETCRLVCPRGLKKHDQVIVGVKTQKGYSVDVLMSVEQAPLEDEQTKRYYARMAPIEALKPVSFDEETLKQSGGIMEKTDPLSDHVTFFQISKKATQWLLKASDFYSEKSSTTRERFYAS